MMTETLYVPVLFVIELARMIKGASLKNTITGAEDDAVIIDILYSPMQQKAVDKIKQELRKFVRSEYLKVAAKRLDQFYVPSGFVKIFARLMQKHRFENILVGVDGDELVIFISYVEAEQKIIDSIHGKIEKYVADQKNDKWKLNGLSNLTQKCDR